MKKIFRLTALLLALTLLSLTACGRNDEEDIESLINTFFESALNLDLDGVLACIDENSDYYADCYENGPMGLDPDSFSPGELLGEDMARLLGDKAESFVDGIMELTRRHSSYSIDSIEIMSDGKAAVETTLILPNYKDMDMTELADDISEASLLEIDPQDFQAYVDDKELDINTATDDDFVTLIYSYLQDKGFLDAITDAILASMDEHAASGSYEYDFTLERIDGRWLITDKNK